MTQPIRAIYEDGHLRLLDPVELTEGEQVEVTIQQQPAPLMPAPPLTADEKFRAALGDSVRFPPPRAAHSDLDTGALQQELDDALKGLPPVSEYIIRERREGP